MMGFTPITNFIKGQGIQWLGDILRRGENNHLRVALEWKPQGENVHRDVPERGGYQRGDS